MRYQLLRALFALASPFGFTQGFGNWGLERCQVNTQGLGQINWVGLSAKRRIPGDVRLVVLGLLGGFMSRLCGIG